jgi:hypothetical protein
MSRLPLRVSLLQWMMFSTEVEPNDVLLAMCKQKTTHGDLSPLREQLLFHHFENSPTASGIY